MTRFVHWFTLSLGGRAESDFKQTKLYSRVITESEKADSVTKGN